MLKYKKRGFTHRSEEHTSELQSRPHLVCRLLLEKKTRAGSRRRLTPRGGIALSSVRPTPSWGVSSLIGSGPSLLGRASGAPSLRLILPFKKDDAKKISPCSVPDAYG